MLRYTLIAAMITTLLPVASAQRPQIVRDVRAALSTKDFSAAQSLLDTHNPKDAAYLEALSWMARTHLAEGNLDEAQRFAGLTRKLSLGMLTARTLDADTSLPLALGASIEVEGQALNQRGQRSEAVSFLTTELNRWKATTIRARIQKNLHLISLKGQPAPRLETAEFIGQKPPALASLKGRKVLLFFWAHWCGDCKAQAPILARLRKEIPETKLAIIAPTQPYGYVAGGEEAPRESEIAYIRTVFEKYYARVGSLAVPLSEENFKAWGSSTTPTLVLINEKGVVEFYHPGKMTYEELAPLLR